MELTEERLFMHTNDAGVAYDPFQRLWGSISPPLASTTNNNNNNLQKSKAAKFKDAAPKRSRTTEEGPHRKMSNNRQKSNSPDSHEEGPLATKKLHSEILSKANELASKLPFDPLNRGRSMLEVEHKLPSNNLMSTVKEPCPSKRLGAAAAVTGIGAKRTPFNAVMAQHAGSFPVITPTPILPGRTCKSAPPPNVLPVLRLENRRIPRESRDLLIQGSSFPIVDINDKAEDSMSDEIAGSPEAGIPTTKSGPVVQPTVGPDKAAVTTFNSNLIRESFGTSDTWHTEALKARLDFDIPPQTIHSEEGPLASPLIVADGDDEFDDAENHHKQQQQSPSPLRPKRTVAKQSRRAFSWKSALLIFSLVVPMGGVLHYPKSIVEGIGLIKLKLGNESRRKEGINPVTWIW